MNWTLAIELNRDALLRVLAALFAMAGLAQGGAVARLPRYVRSAVMNVLRPAESALRRLIVAEARGLSVALRSAATAFDFSGMGHGGGERIPCFSLFDTRKRFETGTVRRVAGPGPRIFFFDGSDLPREPEPPVPLPDDLVTAERLCRRMQALQRALDDLPREARRLARLLARRRQRNGVPQQVMPLRPGFPPGHRQRQVHAVDEILAECDRLARRALEPSDTS